MFLCFTRAFTQPFPPAAPINIDTIFNTRHIEEQTDVFIDSSDQFTPAEVPGQHFTPLNQFYPGKNIPDRLITKPFYLRFSVHNNGKLALPFYYYPGSLFSQINAYKIENGLLKKLAGPKRSTGYVFFEVPPEETNTFLVELEFSKCPFNMLRSKLIAPEYLSVVKLDLDPQVNDKKYVGLVLSGVLLMMILFTLVNFYITRKKEFFYNCMYSLCMCLLIFFTAYLTKSNGWFKAFFLSYFDLFLLIIGTVFYLEFTRCFLNTKVAHPLLDKFLLVEAWVLLALMGIYSFLYFFTDQYRLQMLLENSMKVVILVAGIVYIVASLLKKNRLMNYLATGTSVQILFSVLSFIIILLRTQKDYIFTSAIFYFEMGVIISVVFFLLGLTYKNRQELIEKIKDQEAMKLEVEKKGFETKLAVINAQQEERNRISADMHDDLGAGMTTIRLYSEIAKNKIGNNSMPEIDKISSSADELLIKMNAIIWSMSSSNDSLGNMVAYIRSYAQEYFEDSDIICQISIPEDLPDLEVSGEIRRNIFLVVKEALHNIVKHSGASVVNIILQQEPTGLSLTIRDNGKGIDVENIRLFGNGLKNMRKRMEDVDIAFSISSDHGTVIRLFRTFRDMANLGRGDQ
ncbi:MAG: putative signal transduction histidine kinase [Ferruginibacter sp.]|nr:putative signal transduction histidine kinase [Ferruginibacter sp.]